MAFIYETPVDLCRAAGTAIQYLRGSLSIDEIHDEIHLFGTACMTVGAVALIFGAGGCYACYSGRLGRLGISCGVIGLPLAVLGWDAIQIGRFLYHSADSDRITADPPLYASLYGSEVAKTLGISDEQIRRAEELVDPINKTDAASEFEVRCLDTICANTITARFILPWLFK